MWQNRGTERPSESGQRELTSSPGGGHRGQSSPSSSFPMEDRGRRGHVTCMGRADGAQSQPGADDTGAKTR